ncbi:sulfurtransferase [Nonomuraea guangzhouensis]|uniref:Sulfurtransferase n=1 Tax=Nonomuraea guangzhouensis TaxID=1291555 RepID=A0ABW4G5G8_9ACTN|nr:sulfurtransferase [Nonomuraea guangzhouensis]
MDTRRNPLITVSELKALLDHSHPLSLLDVRWRFDGSEGLSTFRQGHVPGAVFVDLDRELCGQPSSDGRRPIPDGDRFAGDMRRHGVRAENPVIVYDGADSTSASRAWWLLLYFGHSDVRVLDGGLAAWYEAGHSVEIGDGHKSALGDFQSQPGGMTIVDADTAYAIAESGTLVDARSRSRYEGEAKASDLTGGHIPGAVCIPAEENVRADGTFLPVDQLQRKFRDLGFCRAGIEVGAYCGSGILATHTILTLELAGVKAALYPGSWSHWISDPGRPVARGIRPA